MEPHTIEQWLEIFGRLTSPGAPEYAIAQRVIGDLVGYRHNSKHRDYDARQIGNAMRAYARMVHEHGLVD